MKLIITLSLFPRFEPTYKELKLELRLWLLASSDCFEPTYKELKQVGNDIYFVFNLSFEPTYKELKLNEKRILD